jgi:hypothetical protein
MQGPENDEFRSWTRHHVLPLLGDNEYQQPGGTRSATLATMPGVRRTQAEPPSPSPEAHGRELTKSEREARRFGYLLSGPTTETHPSTSRPYSAHIIEEHYDAELHELQWQWWCSQIEEHDDVDEAPQSELSNERARAGMVPRLPTSSHTLQPFAANTDQSRPLAPSERDSNRTPSSHRQCQPPCADSTCPRCRVVEVVTDMVQAVLLYVTDEPRVSPQAGAQALPTQDRHAAAGASSVAAVPLAALPPAPMELC